MLGVLDTQRIILPADSALINLASRCSRQQFSLKKGSDKPIVPYLTSTKLHINVVKQLVLDTVLDVTTESEKCFCLCTIFTLEVHYKKTFLLVIG